MQEGLDRRLTEGGRTQKNDFHESQDTRLIYVCA